MIIYSNHKHNTPCVNTVVLFDLPDFKEEGEASYHRRDSDNKLHGGRASGTCCLNCRKAACVLNVNRLVRHSGCPVILSLDSHKELAVKALSLMYFLTAKRA